MDYTYWKLPVFTDARGALAVLEKYPFPAKRIYFIYDTKEKRGGHAHLKEKEVFVCIAGSFRARIHDGKRWKSFTMKTPGQALYTDAMVWHEFDRFSKDAIMLAVSSTVYKGTKEYILDFKDFLCQKKSS